MWSYIMLSSAEWMGVELQVRWARKAGKEEPVQIDKEIRSALLK